jgi:hypothetical protein
MMNRVFGNEIGKWLFVYVDDVIIFSNTAREHVNHIQLALKRLKEHGLYIKPKKCKFAAQEIAYLGHIINQTGIHTDPMKIEAVAAYPRPRTTTEVHAFLGLASYYRRFIKGYSNIAAPIYELLKKETKFEWTKERQETFNELKTRLTQAPILRRPDWNLEFILQTDASAIGLGAVLAQKKDGHEYVISYASRGTRGAEQNYESCKLECLAVVWAVDKFHYYLAGKHFTIQTDHSALAWLFHTLNPKGIYARWIYRLQEYDCTVKHHSGKTNTNADALSRTPRNTPIKTIQHE